MSPELCSTKTHNPRNLFILITPFYYYSILLTLHSIPPSYLLLHAVLSAHFFASSFKVTIRFNTNFSSLLSLSMQK